MGRHDRPRARRRRVGGRRRRAAGPDGAPGEATAAAPTIPAAGSGVATPPPSETGARASTTDDGFRLPEHPPRDTGARTGATGEVTATREDGSPSTYVVAPGDDLSNIALRFYPDDHLGRSLNRVTQSVRRLNGEPLEIGWHIYLW